MQGSTGNGRDTGPEGPDSIPKFGSMGGIDAKTGAPPASIHESSIGDISSSAKQNFPQDPISHGIGSGSAKHGAHGVSPYGGEGFGILTDWQSSIKAVEGLTSYRQQEARQRILQHPYSTSVVMLSLLNTPVYWIHLSKFTA